MFLCLQLTAYRILLHYLYLMGIMYYIYFRIVYVNHKRAHLFYDIWCIAAYYLLRSLSMYNGNRTLDSRIGE